MLRFLVEVIVPGVWLGWSGWANLRYFQIKRKLASRDDPVLLLSRKEQRERARKLLARQDEEHIEAVYRRLIDGPTQPKGEVT